MNHIMEAIGQAHHVVAHPWVGFAVTGEVECEDATAGIKFSEFIQRWTPNLSAKRQIMQEDNF